MPRRTPADTREGILSVHINPSPVGSTPSNPDSSPNHPAERPLDHAQNVSRTNHNFSNYDDIDPEKLRISNFRALSLKIGSCVIEDGLVAKFYYLRKQIVWEIMKEGLNRKIEIEWSDVIGIKAATREGQPGILGIKLDKPPKFYKEIDPQPRKHPTWNDIPDFTNGEALINRMHYVTFPPGVLDKHYEKLLQSDSQLSMLSQMSFPSQSFLYFESDPQIHDPAITLQNFYDGRGVTWLIPDSQIHHAVITPQNYNELTPCIGVQSFISNPAITLQNYTMAAGPRVGSYISNPAITPQNHTMEAPYVDGVPSLFPDFEVSQLHDQEWIANG